jgi:two-component system, sensor histidine kinase
MKLSFRNISIRFKIIILIVFISSVTLIISAFLFFLYDKSEFKAKTLRDLTILAEVIGNNHTAALTFNDTKSSQELLSSLKAENEITHAVIFNKKGIKLSEYIKQDDTKDMQTDKIDLNNIPSDGYKFGRNSLMIFKKIYLDKEEIGTIYLFATLEAYTKRFYQFAYYLSLLMGYTILGVFVFSVILQKAISAPVIKLSNVMNEVTLKKDYSLRITKNSNDEIGKLCDGFNHMISHIESQNIELEQAITRAEQADKLKSIFLSNMSHEIRTPLNAIIGFSDLLLNKDVSETDRNDYISYINTGSKVLLQLINDIIDFAKIESGQLKINKTETPVGFVLGELYSIFSKEIKIKGKTNVELKLAKTNNNLIIITDQLRLRQILINLISNAIKFTEKGTIEFGFGDNPKDNKTLLFYVKDTGRGINQDKLDLIFERYRQLKQSDIVSGGSGLGLSIAKNLVELLGGTIWAESEINIGSTFYFTLPL